MVAQAKRQERWLEWQIEENSAEAYERYLVPIFFAPWAAQLVDLVAPEPGARVLDVGCGTGIVARTAAARVGPGGTVVGLDLNQGMLAVATEAAAGIRPAIEWRTGDAADLPFPHNAFDVVFCQQAMQFFPDPLAALREMRRVLAPGGRLGLAVLRSIAHNPAYGPLAEVMAGHAGPELGPMMRSPFPDWSLTELRGLVAGAGFRDARLRIGVGSLRYPSVAEFLLQEAAISPLAGVIAALGADAREALIGDLGERLQTHTDDDGVVFPMETYLVVAHR